MFKNQKSYEPLDKIFTIYSLSGYIPIRGKTCGEKKSRWKKCKREKKGRKWKKREELES